MPFQKASPKAPLAKIDRLELARGREVVAALWLASGRATDGPPAVISARRVFAALT